MKHVPLSTLGAATFALIAVTVSSNSIYKSYAPSAPVLVPPMLSDGHLLTAQAANIPINEFTAQQAAQGIVLPKDSHNFFTCNAGGSVSVTANDLGGARTWVYEFTGNEPPFNGAFFISPSELSANPKYSSLNSLGSFDTGKRYYQMGAVDLRFKCGEGITAAESCGDNSCQASESAESCPQDCNVCGDGVVYGSEECDDGDTQDGNGCDASCNVEIGYGCDGEPSACSLLIPELPGISAEPVQNPPPEEPANNAVTTTNTEQQYPAAQEPGNLFITKNPSTQKQAYTTALRLQFHAQDEAIEVTKLNIQSEYTGYDRLELYAEGADNPFAWARLKGCGNSAGYCVQMNNQQLVVFKDTTLNVYVHPVMKLNLVPPTDKPVLSLGGNDAVSARPQGKVIDLQQNNGNNTAEHEIFIGRDSPGPNIGIVSDEQAVASSGITSITIPTLYYNIPDNSPVPTGQQIIGGLSFSGNEGYTFMDGIVFNVDAKNIVFSSDKFTLYNAKTGASVPCEAYYTSGQKFTSTKVSGSFAVSCSTIQDPYTQQQNVDPFSGIDNSTVVNPNPNATYNSLIEFIASFTVIPNITHPTTLVLSGNIENPKLNKTAASSLQIHLQDYTTPGKPFGVGPSFSHIRTRESSQILSGVGAYTTVKFKNYIDYSEDPVSSTKFVTQ